MRCQWAGCTKTDGSVSKLKEHLRSHSQERLIGCPQCGALFANRVKFLDHCKRQRVSSLSNLGFTCNNCGKKFALERLLRDHMRSHINHYKCPQVIYNLSNLWQSEKQVSERHNIQAISIIF